MKQTDSSWGSHNNHLGSTSTMALLHNPLLILSYSDPGIGPHSCHVQNIKVSVWREKNAHLNSHLQNNQTKTKQIQTCFLP